jgi:hypothetical protein
MMPPFFSLRARRRFPWPPLALFVGGAVACGSASAPSPFQTKDAGAETGAGAGGAGGSGGGGLLDDGGATIDPTLGGPCIDDGHCDDGLACTLDACDLKLGRCRFSPDDAACQNGLYCDGIEICDGKLGCRAGEPINCGDGSTCTIDTCDEATHGCTHALRDADGDGDPDGHCKPGQDCNDDDPTISSLHDEVCGNGKDDNCNGAVDETPCTTPKHDTCLDPLEIHAPGAYAMTTAAAAFDYASPCAPVGPPSPVDAVAAIVLPPGPPVDVTVRARTAQGDVAVTLAGQCGEAGSILTCGASFPALTGGRLAKLRARAVGEAGKSVALPLYVTTSYGEPVTLDVRFLEPRPAPTNETCGTAKALKPGVSALAELLDATKDVASVCGAATGELVYSFKLDAPSNVDLYAASSDPEATATLSLRNKSCAFPEDELACAAGHLFRKALPAGTYFVTVAASAPTDVSLVLELSPPTPPGPDEACATAPLLTPNETFAVALNTYQDNSSLGCLPGAVDALYALSLPSASDVLLVQRIAQGDVGSIALMAPACAAPEDLLFCGTGGWSPVRAARHAVPAGDYRVLVESQRAQGVEATAFVRPAVAPVLVPFADGCADALEIPKEGGLFQGNTTNVSANFPAGCDYGGASGNGAPDQLLKLVLDAPKRVVLDMAGSSFATLLDVRKGPDCPGTEVPAACAVGYSADRSFLDLKLTAGTYYIQIDGFNMASGSWFLDVRVVDPSP